MTQHQPKNMLVTGGAGFIGSNFIRHVLSQHTDINIINIDKLTYAGTLNNLRALPNAEHHQFIQGDISNAALMKHLMEAHEIDTIVHFAAESHVDRSIHSPRAFIETNVLGTFTLLEAAREYWLHGNINVSDCRFHHISTDEVYGSLAPHAPAFQETTAYQPRSPYSASKAASDHFVNAYFNTYGLPITMSNCSNNYGPNQHTEKFIPTVIRACIERNIIPIYGKGKNIRDWLYVEDHCRAIMTILQHGKLGEAYNVGGNNEWENLALAQHLCMLIDKFISPESPSTELISFIQDRPGHDFRYAINDSKLRNELQWQPLETLHSGLEKTIRYYLSEHTAVVA